FESGGKKVAFSLATTEVYYDKEQQKREITEWHNIVMWRGLAETAEKYLKKGDLLYVEGRIRTRSWDDKETQQKKYITEIQVDTMNMLGSPKAHQNGADTALLQVTEADQGGDLPF
ncbi:MAG TPA: single-stranded DNA-binding protein, partial [Bacteroidales bacterium]|nr:single-stranded DNA-binding protein [Bacteroidales bacterium]